MITKDVSSAAATTVATIREGHSPSGVVCKAIEAAQPLNPAKDQASVRLIFHIDSLYPLLYRLEERGWIKGTWVEKAGERRRRFYRLTATGRRVFAQQQETWDGFVEAVRLVTRGDHA